MSQHALGIIAGGLAPALFYCVFPIFMKYSSQHQLSPGALLLCIGIAVSILGGLVLWAWEGSVGTITMKGTVFGLLAGICWGLGALGVSIAVSRFGTPVSLLTPIFNTNTLIAVLLGLVVFSEWKTVQLSWLLGGTALIVAGSIVISRA